LRDFFENEGRTFNDREWSMLIQEADENGDGEVLIMEIFLYSRYR